MDPRLTTFRAQLLTQGWETLSYPYTLEEDPEVTDYVWILNVPKTEQERVAEEAYTAAFALWGDDPLPFILGIATPEKTRLLTLPKHLG